MPRRSLHRLFPNHQPMKGKSVTDSNEQDFAAVFMQHAKGRAHTEASKKLAEVVEAVMETGKPGSITVKLTISRDKDLASVVKIADQVAAKIPTEPRRSMWFPDDDGQLHRNDPRQTSLFEDGPVEKIQAPEGN
ncbi:hypothetical protein SEA_NEOBUSH_52 [Gordonia phage Neobush]|uniref:Uncharacterized protein n=5 Tax=Nymphadoravirus kita TaxID=2170041 RepID=A0A8T8JDU9_9CAUD|nr:hypothetical protein SEA_TAYONIA_52 [Gordonia phage Tayonia]QDF16533.1 hypothetical protein SEA_ZAMEEN_52 [Gordonia phage Zameen]QDH48878.1 hypothetical protein SEA_SUSCEPIT_52 [Gordonia phage Suscepit]QUE26159.1 hypothetical protein SEA_TRUMPET_52 [Gordonia phage Trumpet]QUE26337.1 hypothetical protein SEA_NEOBUSH_52 [Gordonia phage Neobush]